MDVLMEARAMTGRFRLMSSGSGTTDTPLVKSRAKAMELLQGSMNITPEGSPTL